MSLNSEPPRYSAGWNAPGADPDPDDIRDFESFEEAVRYLVNEVESRWDQDYDEDESGHEEAREKADEKWLPVHTALHNAGPPAFRESNGDESLVFWINDNYDR